VGSVQKSYIVQSEIYAVRNQKSRNRANYALKRPFWGRPFIAQTSKNERAPLGADPERPRLANVVDKNLGAGIETPLRWLAHTRIVHVISPKICLNVQKNVHF